MPRPSGLPKRIPAGSKYVVESHGGFVRRFVELPGGRKLKLASRKVQTCDCMDTSLVPALVQNAPKPARGRRALERA